MDAYTKDVLRALAAAYLRGERLPLETALELAKNEDDAPSSIQQALTDCVMVASETDAIPLGERRAFWHADVRNQEDQRHDEAQAWAAPIVRQACEDLIALL
jgi:hypothetical protein